MTIEEAIEALDRVNLEIGVVSTRPTTTVPPMHPVHVLRQDPLPGERIDENQGVAIEVSVPEDPDVFMTLPSTPLCTTIIQTNCIDDSEDSAIDYYAAIDPAGEKTTFNDWLAANGFDTRGAGADANAIYFNEFDLGFGRNMRMRFASPDHIAYAVTNHRNVDEAFAQSDRPINIVAMEYSVTPGSGTTDPFIKFYTFDENGNRINEVELDNRGDKFQPVMCMSCHGGLTNTNLYPGNGDVEVPGFIPFDLDSFLYSEEFNELSRRNQEAAFRQLNAGVLSSWQSIGAQRSTRWTTPTVPIPDGNPNGIALELDVDDVDGIIRDVNVSFENVDVDGAPADGLQHPAVSDLTILLTSPNGTTSVLYDGETAGASTNVRFDDEAETTLQEAARSEGGLAGIVAPSRSLSAFDGESPNGNWYLTVIDEVPGNAGLINGWSLNLRIARGTPSPAEELILGWYGEPTGTTPEGLPIFANDFDGTFVPQSWLVSDQSIELYDRVVERSCRTCHVMQDGRRAAFGTFENFETFAALIERRVFEQGNMPDALRTFHNFWTGLAVVDNEVVPVIPSGPEVLAAYLGRPLSGPGTPLANPGEDRTVTFGTPDSDLVTVDGSESSFAETYTWSWDPSSAAMPPLVTSPNSAFASFTPTVPGEHRLRLVVTSGPISSAPDVVVITVVNPAPVAVAGVVGPSAVQPGINELTVQVQLDGTGSTDDSDGEIIEYIWTADTTFNPATPDPDDVAMPTVTLPANSQHRFLLQVRDNFGSLSANTDDQSISVSSPLNGPPAANAGSNQTLVLDLGDTSTSVQLDGSASTDPENVALTYTWEVIAPSPGGTPDPVDTASPTVVLARSTATDTLYRFRLTVTDDQNVTDTDDVDIVIRRGGPSYANEIAGMLNTGCVACHAGGNFNASADAATQFASVSALVNSGTPQSSAILVRPSSAAGVANCSGITHSGGVRSGFDWCDFQTGGGNVNTLLTTPIASLPANVQEYARVLRWIVDGAECTDCP